MKSHTQAYPYKRYDDTKLYDADHNWDSFSGEKPRRVLVKIFNSAGTYLGLLENVSWDDFHFTKKINGGHSELILKTNKAIDDYDEGTLINHKNQVEIYLTDYWNTDILIYSGFISVYNPYIDENGEGVDITILPSLSELTYDFFRSGTDLEVAKNSMEISDIIRDAIDKYREWNPNGLVNYDATLQNTGNTISYTFRFKKTLEVIRKCAEFFPQNWYWYCPANGNIIVKEKSGSADYTLIIGKEIKILQTHKNIDSIINKIIFWNGRESTDPLYIYTEYNNDASQSSYGVRSHLIKDGRITVAATANAIANKILNENKDPKTEIVLEISHPEFNHAAIEPGETISIRNIDTSAQTTFPDNLQIKEIDYYFDRAILTVGDQPENISIDIPEELDDKFDKIIQDLEDRVLDIPNVNLSVKARAHTVVVGTDYEYTDIQTAIDAVEALGGGIVFITEGVYIPTSIIKIPDNVILKGEDPAKTIIDLNNHATRQIKLEDTGTYADLTDYTTGTITFTLNSKTVTGVGTTWLNNVRAGSLIYRNDGGVRKDYLIASVDSNTQITLETDFVEATASGIAYVINRKVHDFGLFDLTITNMGGNNSNISFTRGRNFVINNCFINGADMNGILLSECEMFEISKNTVDSNGGDGINSVGSFTFTKKFIINNQCNNNSDDGIYIDAAYTQCTDNVCLNNGGDGIEVNSLGDNSTVKANNCRGNTGVGVRIIAGCISAIIANNQLAGNTGGGIVDGGTTTVLDNNVTS